MAYAGTDEVARLEKALDNTRRPVELIKISPLADLSALITERSARAKMGIGSGFRQPRPSLW
jgi:hypothetical protein